jgi:hypothetical protein
VLALKRQHTPQFDWVKSRLPRRAKPVPPIFQPEVAAGLADRYLARHGYDAQQTWEPEDRDALTTCCRL